MRRDEPEGCVVARIMDQGEVDSCISHPRCIVASDTYYTGEGAHPRTAGTFPKALRIARGHGYGWRGALEKVTTMPADMMKINAGKLYEGAAADVVVFDPESYADRATYSNPLRAPDGVKLVLVGGAAAVRDGVVNAAPCGTLRERPKD
jgi:N-acyl-D-amino-acid deacylase